MAERATALMLSLYFVNVHINYCNIYAQNAIILMRYKSRSFREAEQEGKVWQGRHPEDVRFAEKNYT